MITDGRFSGGTHGFSIGHVGPEAAVGGPIGLIKNGDLIEKDTDKGLLTEEDTQFEQASIIISTQENISPSGVNER